MTNINKTHMPCCYTSTSHTTSTSANDNKQFKCKETGIPSIIGNKEQEQNNNNNNNQNNEENGGTTSRSPSTSNFPHIGTNNNNHALSGKLNTTLLPDIGTDKTNNDIMNTKSEFNSPSILNLNNNQLLQIYQIQCFKPQHFPS